MIIYSKDGLIQRYDAKKFSYNGTFLGEAYLTTTITSEIPIAFQIGDYCEYRGERFELNYIPAKVKVASVNSYGEAFKYEDIKFEFLASELSHCSFLDYVPFADNTQYSGMSDFSFTGTIYNLSERIQANLDRIYKTTLSGTVSTTSGSYVVTGVGTSFTSLSVGDRLTFGTQERIVASIESDTSLTSLSILTANQSGVNAIKYHWSIKILSGYTTPDYSVSASNINCMDALALANTTFKANFIIRGRTVTMGTAGIDVGTVFGYGKGNGLKSITQTTDNDSDIITRLRVFGNTTNIPYRWYNKQIKPSTGLPYIPDTMYVPKLTLPNFLQNGGDVYIEASADANTLDGGEAETTAFVYNFDGGDTESVPLTEILDGGEAESLISYVDLYGVREGIVFFDGSDDREDIHPTLEGVTATQLAASGITVTAYAGDNGNLDEIHSVINPTDNGIIPDGGSELDGTFIIVLKDVGFDLSEKNTDGNYKYASSDGDMTISIKSGNCTGREFAIVENGITKVTDAGVITYKLVCNRQTDGDIGMAFPNTSYQVNAGDKFVIVNIQMPDVYVYAAMQKLLVEGRKYLSENNTSKFTYEPAIDNIYMAEHPAIGYSLKEGDRFNFEDLDLPISKTVTIKTLEIKEGESLIPQYSIILSDENAPSTIQNITNEIEKIKGITSNLGSIEKGAQGEVGAVLAYRGEYDADETYHGGKTYRDSVIYNGLYYVTRTDAGNFSNRIPTDVSKWVIFGSQLESIATGLLLAESAYIINLIVSQLATSSNPYASRFANVGTGVGVFKNLEDQANIGNAIIAMGKDTSLWQAHGEKKPAFTVYDGQWRGTYSATNTYYKDDRVYYNGYTYIFDYQWLETETPTPNIVPNNYAYWRILGAGNLGGGNYSEMGCDGIVSNGSNINGFPSYTAIASNCSLFANLLKRLSDPEGISSAIIGLDNTTSANGVSKSYGGYFTRLFVAGLYKNIRNVTISQTLLKTDCTIHCYATSDITLVLPVPDNAMVGMEITVRKLGASGWCYINSHVADKIWNTSAITTLALGNDDSMTFTWDGNYWVTSYNNN